ncbi:Uncharacterized protein TCM_038168 [Theobroma cacao]|uniref:Uncharacterized protein n=1 Tax=Theobroma cacao TaxID=3641 RepID=A0A061GVT1_THECC|nr:Uncharacterized protein TCM_038168 [Theobroma cacao]
METAVRYVKTPHHILPSFCFLLSNKRPVRSFLDISHAKTATTTTTTTTLALCPSPLASRPLSLLRGC